ncbi:glycoside hydrolase family 28 protein [Labilibaculum euxinus]
MRLPILCIALIMALLACNRQKENASNESVPESSNGWEYADSVRNEIQSAKIPTDTLRLIDFGSEDDSQRIQKAIDHVYELGGGTILIPSGIYYTGPIVLKSKINLYLEEGAELKFIAKPEIYPLAYNWFNGIPCMNYSSMIYAKDASDIQISGKGIIDGQGNDPVWKSMKFHERKDWELLKELENTNVKPINRKFGNGHSIRPDLITFLECSRINISGVSIKNAPFWVIHPILCKHVTIKKCLISSHGYDQIGIGLESSENILVDSTKFQFVDDGVKILSGRVKIPNNRASKNIVIQNSIFENVLYSAVIISSQTQAGANHIFLSDLKIDTSETALRIFANAGLKGKLHEIFLKNIQANHITGSFLLSNINNSSNLSNSSPLLYNIHLDKINAENCGRAFLLNGHSKNLIYNVNVRDSRFSTFKGSFVKNLQNMSFSNVRENEKNYSGTNTVGNIQIPKINLEHNEDDILNSNNIKFNDLPKSVKNTLAANYPQILVNNIDQMITQSNIIYNINLKLESSKELKLLVLADGKIMRSKSDITFGELPKAVISALQSYLKITPAPLMINEIKKIAFQDFAYFEIKGEYNRKLFAVGINNNGDIIEEKQKIITTYFSPSQIK